MRNMHHLRKLRGTAGQDLVEYAMILPFLLLLLLGIMEFGIAIFAYNSIASAAREGARYGIVHPNDFAGIEAAARTSAEGLRPGALQVLIDVDSELVEVEVLYAHSFITGPLIDAVGGNPALNLRTVATMNREQ
jgi:hypothetical protein